MSKITATPVTATAYLDATIVLNTIYCYTATTVAGTQESSQSPPTLAIPAAGFTVVIIKQ